MKFRLPFLAAICVVLLASVAAANDWSAVTDEIDVDYSNSIVRSFSVVKRTSGYTSAAKNQCRKTLLSYLGTLTHGKENIRLEDEFKKRPALYGKVQHALEQHMRNGESADLPATDQYSLYMLFDLKHLKPLIPDLNMPSQDDLL